VGKYVRAIPATDDSAIRRMHFAYLITNAIDSHSEYVILFGFVNGDSGLGERVASLLLYVQYIAIASLVTQYVVVPYSPSWLAEYHHLNSIPFNVPLNF